MNPRPLDLIDALMSGLLAKMSVISEVAGRSYDGNLVHGGEKDHAPAPFIEKPLVDFYRDRYQNAHTEKSRRAVFLDAVEGLRSAKLARKAPPIYGTVEWRMAIAHDPRPVHIVAWAFGCTERHVYRVRADSKSLSVRKAA